MKTVAAAEQAAAAALEQTGASRWIAFAVEAQASAQYRQENRGRPGADTRYRKISRTRHRIRYTVDETQVAATPPPTAATR
jgi:hypothetical protein